ncbi:MAG: ribonuclease P protein component [Myxococcales bacterium]|nr:ribonuclease P protein component [Myxococcales bacterium]
MSANSERISSREFVVLLSPPGPRATGRARLGITASRRVGNAVARNRVKRAVRTWFRTCASVLPVPEAGLDIVVIARREAAELRPDVVGERLSAMFRRRARAQS